MVKKLISAAAIGLLRSYSSDIWVRASGDKELRNRRACPSLRNQCHPRTGTRDWKGSALSGASANRLQWSLIGHAASGPQSSPSHGQSCPTVLSERGLVGEQFHGPRRVVLRRAIAIAVTAATDSTGHTLQFHSASRSTPTTIVMIGTMAHGGGVTTGTTSVALSGDKGRRRHLVAPPHYPHQRRR